MIRGALIAVAVVLVAGLGAWFLFLSPVCACSPTPSGPASPVDGVVISVDAQGLTAVTGFELRPNAGGPTLHFSLGTLENATQFPPGHLKEHQASGSPIRVYYVGQGSALIVYRLEDAPVPSSTAPSSNP
jgi:hypothetical protein